ncbi:fatty acyl-AMP ligase [Streptomyces scopuliridis]
MLDLSGATSVSETMRRHARDTGDRPALAIVGTPVDRATAQWLTYAQLDQAARVFAQELRRACPVGSRVLLLHPTSAEFVAGFLGCLYAGMVAVPSSMPGRYRQDQRRVLAIAEDAEVGCVLITPDERDEVTAWVEQEGFTMPVLALRVDLTRHADDLDVFPADLQTLAVLQYTSGSTNDPKGNMVTHGNLLANAASTATAFPARDGRMYGGWLPNYHDMGLMGIILTPLLAGYGTALMSPAAFLRRPRAWLELVERFDIALSPAPNFAYELCLTRMADDDLSGLDLSRWPYAGSGSEPVNARVLDAFAERFASAGFRPESFAPSFGMAEATLFVSTATDRVPVVLHCDPDALEHDRVEPAADGKGRALVSLGEPRDLDVRIVDIRTRRELPPGQVGEIWMRGTSVVQGYWRNEESTAATFDQRLGDEGGFMRTGDLGVIVAGELYVTGRIKEMMIIRGRNIYPHDIEHELRLQHEPLRDTFGSAIAVPSPRSGDEELVVVHEVRRRSSDQELAALAASIRNTVAREFGLRAHAVLLMRRGGVHRTTSGKVQRAVMRSLYLSGELRPLWSDGYLPRPEAILSGTGDAR